MAAGKKLRIKQLNGNLVVRTGGGYQDLLTALGRAPQQLASPTGLGATWPVLQRNSSLGRCSSLGLQRCSSLGLQRGGSLPRGCAVGLSGGGLAPMRLTSGLAV